MRTIRRIVIHFTGGWPSQSTSSIKNYWKKDLGWKQVGYHIIISEDGTRENLAPLSAITNGVKGYNSDSIHICYKGGLKEITKDGKYIYGDTRTPAQKRAIEEAIISVIYELWDNGKGQPVDNIPIMGHRDLSKDLNKNDKIEEREWIKICPGFNAIEEYGGFGGDKATERLKKRSTY